MIRWGLVCLLACTHGPPRDTTVPTAFGSVTLADRWSPTTDCDLDGSRSLDNAILIGRAVAEADRAGLPLTPVFGDRLPRVVVIATRPAEVEPSDNSLVLAIEADERGHALIRYTALGYGNVYCAVLRDGHVTLGQPPLDVRQVPAPAAPPPPPGLEGCNLSVPLPPVLFDDYDPTNRECPLGGDYAPANFCLVARALASQGVTWTDTAVLPEERSQTLIKDIEGLDRRGGRLIVNPRRAGEVSIQTSHDAMSYCTWVTPDQIVIRLWQHIASTSR